MNLIVFQDILHIYNFNLDRLFQCICLLALHVPLTHQQILNKYEK
jgi:hypothetical protein